MARSKGQWMAQHRALHTQTQSKSFVQMKRPMPHPPAVRPTAPPAVFQLGRPTTGTPPVVAAVQPAVFKPDPVQAPQLSGNSSGQAIDLTLDDEDDDDDDEEEDEPMGTQLPVTAAPAMTAMVAVSSAASDAVKLSMLDGTDNKDAEVVQSLQQTELISDIMAPLVEDVESDVDEDFPVMLPSTSSSVPPSVSLAASSLEPLPVPTSEPLPVSSSAPQVVNDLAAHKQTKEDVRESLDAIRKTVPVQVEAATPQAANDLVSHNRTKEDVRAALDANRETVPISQERQNGGDAEQNVVVEVTTQQTCTPPLYGDDDNDMEADVDEELPNQAPKSGEGSPTTADRLVDVESLEDGEIFEEGAAPKPTMQVQQAMIRDNQPGYFDAHSVDAMGIRPHLRNKKQKKRGKKKNKRKLEAMQMMHTPPGEMLLEFERSTRQRLFAEAPPPGQYTMAMMRNGPKGEPMGMRPVYQDPPPAPFRPGGPPVGGLHPPLPPPPSYEDSQILRVNRQGSMEMLDGGAGPSFHPMFSEPPMHGGFKYRSVSMSPPRIMAGGQSHSLQRSVSDTSRLPPIPSSGHGDTSNIAVSKERDGSEDFDLDSLRAAALRSKVKRPLKTSTSTPSTTVPTVSVIHSSSSSSLAISPMTNPNEKRHSESTSPEIDKLRLEILRSMTRNRKRTASKSINNVQVPTPPISEANAVELPNQNSDCAKSADGEDKVINEKPITAQRDSSATKEPSNPMLPTIAHAERTVSNGPSFATDKSATASEQNEVGEKAKPALPSASGSAMPSAEPAVTTPQFRPLTACSQSLVIRLSPEDFSPRKSGDDTRTKSTASSSLHDAIKEMRRKIAEREKEQINRLLETTAARLSNQSSGSSSSPASSSSTPPELSPGTKVSTIAAQPSGASTISPEVSSSATKIVKEPHTAATAEGVESKRVTDGVNAHANRTEGTIEQASPSEGIPVVETSPGEKPAMEIQEQNDTSAQDVLTLPVSDGVREEKSCDAPVSGKSFSTDASISGSANDELDFDAIRAEYEQCVAECKEADMHIARLSNEMAQLEKQLPPVG